METIDFELIVQVIAILGASFAVLLTVLEIVDTYLDIGKKLRERRRTDKEGAGKAIQQESSKT